MPTTVSLAKQINTKIHSEIAAGALDQESYHTVGYEMPPDVMNSQLDELLLRGPDQASDSSSNVAGL